MGRIGRFIEAGLLAAGMLASEEVKGAEKPLPEKQAQTPTVAPKGLVRREALKKALDAAWQKRNNPNSEKPASDNTEKTAPASETPNTNDSKPLPRSEALKLALKNAKEGQNTFAQVKPASTTSGTTEKTAPVLETVNVPSPVKTVLGNQGKPENTTPTLEKKGDTNSAKVAWEKFLNQNVGGTDIEDVLKDADRLRKRVDSGELKQDISELLAENVECLKLKYNILKMLKQERDLWEQHVKAPNDEKLHVQLVRHNVALQVLVEEASYKLKGPEYILKNPKLGSLHGKDRVIYIYLSGFRDNVKQVSNEIREYYYKNGAKIHLRPLVNIKEPDLR